MIYVYLKLGTSTETSFLRHLFSNILYKIFEALGIYVAKRHLTRMTLNE